MNNGLVPFIVTHKRLVPKRYEFIHRFFWFKIDLNKPKEWPTKLVSWNKFNLYSFYDKDHLNLGESTARENYIRFARENGLNEKIENVTIYTQLRFLGYVFNPVSFVLLKDAKGAEHAIIEIGNTFNELKPFFVPSHCFKENGFRFRSKKFFYISPFIDHDNELVFSFVHEGEKIKIYIEDSNDKEKVLQVWFNGKIKKATSSELLRQTIVVPFVTFKIIGLIHYHALVLWLKKIKYYKKSEKQDLQQGTFIWKN